MFQIVFKVGVVQCCLLDCLLRRDHVVAFYLLKSYLHTQHCQQPHQTRNSIVSTELTPSELPWDLTHLSIEKLLGNLGGNLWNKKVQ